MWATGGVYLELVQNLEVHRIQVAQRHILQGILQRVQHRRDRQLPPVTREHLVVYLLKQHRHGRLRRQAPRDLVHGEGQGYRQLDDLVEQDGGRGKVTVVARRGHYPRVVHDLKARGVSGGGGGRGGSGSTGDDAPGSGPSSATSTVLALLVTRTASSDSEGRAYCEQRRLLHGHAEQGRPRCDLGAVGGHGGWMQRVSRNSGGLVSSAPKKKKKMSDQGRGVLVLSRLEQPRREDVVAGVGVAKGAVSRRH